MYKSTKRYIVSITASLAVLLTSIIILLAYSVHGIDYPGMVHYLFTILVSLVAVDTISLVFLSMWVIGLVEGLDAYIRKCMSVGECGIALGASRAKIIEILNCPIWYMILYVVSVTFVTSAAYIVVVLVKYGFRPSVLSSYSEGVFASSLLYILGFVLGAIASLVIMFSLVRLGDYTGIDSMYYSGLILSVKYIVDIATLVFNIALSMSLLGLMTTILAVYYTVKMDKEVTAKIRDLLVSIK